MLRMHERTRSVPAIMITGSHKRIDRETMGLEVHAVLQKPVSQGQLLKVIESVLGKRPESASSLPAQPAKLEVLPFDRNAQPRALRRTR